MCRVMGWGDGWSENGFMGGFFLLFILANERGKVKGKMKLRAGLEDFGETKNPSGFEGVVGWI